jgi:hypothetical protein
MPLDLTVRGRVFINERIDVFVTACQVNCSKSALMGILPIVL